MCRCDRCFGCARGECYTPGSPLLAGEDFAFMLQRTPSSYLSFGQRGSERGGTPVHNPSYDFNDEFIAHRGKLPCQQELG
jgi:metal-dependent amidase/aminoacylase/carboxypeptidase family protein